MPVRSTIHSGSMPRRAAMGSLETTRGGTAAAMLRMPARRVAEGGNLRSRVGVTSGMGGLQLFEVSLDEPGENGAGSGLDPLVDTTAA